MKKILLLLATLLMCSLSYSQNKNQNIQETQARLLDINPNAYVKPLTVEISVLPGGRISDTWTLSSDQVKSLGGDLASIRSWGVFQSSRKYNCDLIVAGTFEFKTDPDKPDQFLLTVVGFPANFINWRTAEEKDYEWIRLEKTQTTNDRDKIKAIIK